MEQLNPTEINEALKDVRNAYRLLALYQTRLLSTIKYIANNYNTTLKGGWSKFSHQASHGSRVGLDKWSWDWLSMYLYEFSLVDLEIEGDIYYLKIIHQADTGFYDENEYSKISKTNPEQFGNVNRSSTRLFFLISKNEDGYPLQKILNGHLTTEHVDPIIKGNWLAVPYSMQRFSNHTETDIVLNDFNERCKNTFGVDLLHIKKE